MTTPQFSSLREKIAFEKRERIERYATFEAAYAAAHEAGDRAAKATIPTAMFVTQHANPLDDASPIVRQDFCEEGVKGFARIRIKPASSSFGHWLKKTGKCDGRAYGGGLDICVFDYGQSLERKVAYARAFTAVLVRELAGYGLSIYPTSRED